jgi:hypothetical protein
MPLGAYRNLTLGRNLEYRLVQDGLVLHLDAGNKTSYPGSGTTWTDISGNSNNGTLTNGPTYDPANKGSIVFDGKDDYVDVTDTPLRITGVSFTMEVWFYYDGNSSNAYTIAGKRNGTTPFNQYTLWIGDGTTSVNPGSVLGGFVRIDESTSYDRLANYTLPSAGIYHVALTNDSSSLKLYVNNVLRQTVSNTYPSPANLLISGKNFRITEVNLGNKYLNGKVYTTKLYNRALSQSEVKQNFTALRGRYGI